MSKILPPWSAVRELEQQIGVLKSRNRQLQDRANYIWHHCIELENELAKMRDSREFRMAREIRERETENARRVFRRKWAQLMLKPMDLPRRLLRSDRLLEAYRETFTENDPMIRRLRRRDIYRKLAAEAPETPRLPADLPLTSVIILCDGSREHLARCRMSIKSASPRAPFEILLVAPSSCRLSRRSFPQARIIRSADGSGWQDALDLAARQADGEYLLFLDGAAEVLPGWLDELALALYRNPDAGPIGAQLLDPDTGTLRSSGHILGDDGTIIPCGAGKEPDFPAFSHFRETDLCFEAGCIVRKMHFFAAGGFDPADGALAAAGLALRCRKAGRTCRVMPLARIVLHRELPEPTEAERARIAALYSGIPTAEAPKRRLFYVDYEVPMPDRGSGGMDAVFFMEWMVRTGFQVAFFGESMATERRRYENDLERIGVEIIRPSRVWVADYLREHGASFDIVFVSRVYEARYMDMLIRRYAPQAAYVFDTVDLHFIRERREADLADSDVQRLQALMTEVLELTVADRADAVIVISSEEKKLLEEKYEMARVHHLPQARECFGCRASFAERRGIAFVGSAHPPNLDALMFYVQDILPLLEKKGVDGTLTVIGEALRDEIRRGEKFRCVAECPKIVFAGYVEDLRTYFDRVRLTIAPLRYGAGTKGKIASSMACGVPCVSTRFGTEGTGMIDGENVRIADTPEAFASAMAELLTDEAAWRRVSDGGMKFLKDNYDPEMVGRQTTAVLEAALEHKRSQDREVVLLTGAEGLAATALRKGRPDLSAALLRCGPRGSASILCEMLRRRDRHELRRRFRWIFFAEDISVADAGKYDYLVLDKHPQSELCELLKIAKYLLHDGGRVVFPLPPDLDAERFWNAVRGEIGFSQLFSIMPDDGGSHSCLCAAKEIPDGNV